MDDCLEFGDCLLRLLSCLHIKYSRLAKGINIDPSLVNRWIHGGRVPAYNSNYIDLIANYISSYIINSFQEKFIQDTLNQIYYGKKCSEEMYICEKVSYVLKEAQGYSIEIKKKAQSRIKMAAVNNSVSGLLSKSNVNSTIEHGNGFSTYIHSLAEKDNASSFKIAPGFLLGFPKVESRIITGNKEVLQCMIALIQAASQKEGNEEEPILITFNRDINSLPAYEYKEFLTALEKVLLNDLNRGWKITTLIRIDNNIDRMMEVIHDILLFPAIGNYEPYYVNKYYLFSTGREMLVIPGIGAMITFPLASHSQEESALYIENKDAVKMLCGHYYHLLSMAHPLLKKYPSEKSMVFMKMLAEYEEKHGSRCHYSKDINSLTIPLSLYEKYLRTADKPMSELMEIIELHKRRLQAFNSNVKDYKYKDICTMESIERLIHYSRYPSDNLSLLGECKPARENIIMHIDNIIFMLEKYDNYEIAFVNETQLHCEAKSIWIINGKAATFTKTQHSENLGYDNYDLNNPEIYLSIEEPTIINTFEVYFMDLWNSIAPLYKDKKKVITWLKAQIEFLET